MTGVVSMAESRSYTREYVHKWFELIFFEKINVIRIKNKGFLKSVIVRRDLGSLFFYY